MKSIITLLPFLFIFLACETKEVNKSEELKTDSAILTSLNQGDSDETLKKLDELDKTTNDPERKNEILLLKASALAQKAGVDIFSLYDVLELNLFAAPLADMGNSSFAFSVKKITKQKISEEEIFQLEEKISQYFESNSHYQTQNLEEDLVLLFEEDLSTEQSRQLAKDFHTNLKKVGQDLDKNSANDIEAFNDFLSQEIIDNGMADIIEDSISVVNKDIENFNDSKLKLFDFMGNIFQALPIIESLPEIKKQSQVHIYSALNLLVQIPDSSVHYTDAKDYLTILSSVSFLNNIKSAMFFSDISNPIDLVCNVIENGNVAQDTADSLNEDIKYLKIAYKDSPEVIEGIENGIENLVEVLVEKDASLRQELLNNLFGSKELSAITVLCGLNR